MARLALGTAQFGLDYGITNTSGTVQPKEVKNILSVAAQSNIRVLDTAAGYGRSEQTLATVLPDAHAFKIVTKLMPQSLAQTLGMNVTDRFKLSLTHFQQHIYAVLVHHASDLSGEAGKRIGAILRKAQDAGSVKKIGVSIYDEAQWEGVKPYFSPGIVQLPFNILDQRLAANGFLRNLSAQGVEIHVRSVFLQGLLLSSPESLPPHLAGLRPAIERFDRRADELGCDRMTLALAAVKNRKEISDVVVGVTSAAQLQEIVRAWDAAEAYPIESVDDLVIDEPVLLNPAKWRELELR